MGSYMLHLDFYVFFVYNYVHINAVYEVTVGEIELVDVWKQANFVLRNRYRCPHCRKKNKTESILESFKDFDKATEKLWGTCRHCGEDFQLQGKATIRKATIATHTECRCGRHFLFFLERDIQLVRFSRFLETPYLKCPLCRRKVLLRTPGKPVRYLLAVGWLQLLIQVARQRRAFRRTFQRRN